MRRLFYLGGPENGRRKRYQPLEPAMLFLGYDVAVMYSRAVGRYENTVGEGGK